MVIACKVFSGTWPSGKALALGARDRGFDPLCPNQYGRFLAPVVGSGRTRVASGGTGYQCCKEPDTGFTRFQANFLWRGVVLGYFNQRSWVQSPFPGSLGIAQR